MSNTFLSQSLYGNFEDRDQLEASQSRIVSIQNFKGIFQSDFRNLSDHFLMSKNFLFITVTSDQSLVDITCIVWSLVNKKSPSACNYYLSVFNLNDWYIQCMPSRIKTTDNFDLDAQIRNKRNCYLINYSLSLNNEIETLKVKIYILFE